MRLNHVRLANASSVLCILLAVATACATFAAAWWFFELFVHFRVQYALSAVVLALLLWPLRRRAMALLALGLAVVNAIPVAPLLFAPAKASTQILTQAGEESVRVVSVNVFGSNREYERVIGYVRSRQADVAIFLEVTPQWARALQALRDEFAYSWVVPTGERAGIAVFARKPPLQVQEVDLGETGEPSLLLTVATGDNGGSGEIKILGTHLYWPLGPRVAAVRNRQLEAIARLAREHPGRFVVAGDFNVTAFSPHLRRTLRSGNLRDCAADHGLMPTWPARLPLLFIRIDHCLATPDLTVRTFQTGPYVGSDHYPIYMELQAAAPLVQGP